jgi:lipopolysaccharide/colanic/teichoic acid biosynthesis glycosyltransferase
MTWSKRSSVERPSRLWFQRLLKRAFDLGFTLVASLVLLPVAMLVSLIILLDSPGPILYRSFRVGRGGRKFTLYKFRTMVPQAEELGPSVTHRGDSRVTRVGRLLRRTKFDELPQVLNVLRGEMSIVGPRPELPKYVALFPEEYQELLRMRPGLTSLAQIAYRDEEDLLPDEETEAYYITQVLPRKLALDLYYVRHWSLALDFQVFCIGLLALLRIPVPSRLWPVKEEPAPPSYPALDGGQEARR